MYNLSKISAILLFNCFISSARAQPTLDTLRDCLNQKPHLFAKFDTRNSFIGNARAKIVGIKTGLNYGKRLHFGIGYNQLYPPATNFDRHVYYVNSQNIRDSVLAKLTMYYFSVHVEYVFYQTKQWELSMPLQIGIGKTYYNYFLLNEKRKDEENINFIYEPAVSVGYKFFKWLGVGADIGFRFMVTQDRKLNLKFNSPIYAFKLLLYYNEMYKSLFPNSSLSKKL